MNQYINISVCRSTHQVLYELRSVPPDRFDRLEDVDLSVLDDLLDTRVRGAVHTAPGQYKGYCVQYTAAQTRSVQYKGLLCGSRVKTQKSLKKRQVWER